jgi:hypothetical protein
LHAFRLHVGARCELGFTQLPPNDSEIDRKAKVQDAAAQRSTRAKIYSRANWHPVSARKLVPAAMMSAYALLDVTRKSFLRAHSSTQTTTTTRSAAELCSFALFCYNFTSGLPFLAFFSPSRRVACMRDSLEKCQIWNRV